MIDYQQLQQTLHHRFNDLDLLREALRHSSFVNEQTDPDLRDNERLEFLGDAVLNLTIGHLLMQRYPQMREGDLSRIRANMVNESQLAEVARELDLGRHLMLGKGEIQSGGMDKNSILANAVEALIAAVYLDQGFEAAFTVIERHFRPLIEAAPELNAGQDYKSRLQEAVQTCSRTTPHYRVVAETGPDHDKTFHVVMVVGDLETNGTGKSKKLAEQDAACKGLALIQRDEDDT
ncbi:MAG: ribonuclease III [Desulfatitalea sp.]|nr:ribonuclease III [Desulfatitalea sp.]NNK02712.1 ribonuclease III [Desulfatitalea sp.]